MINTESPQEISQRKSKSSHVGQTLVVGSLGQQQGMQESPRSATSRLNQKSSAYNNLRVLFVIRLITIIVCCCCCCCCYRSLCAGVTQLAPIASLEHQKGYSLQLCGSLHR